MSAPLMTYVVRGYYGFGSAEVWAAFASVAVFALLYAAVHARIGALARRCLEAALLLLLADLYFESRYVPALAALAWFAAGHFLRTAPHRVMAVFGGAALVASIGSGLLERKPWIIDVANPGAAVKGVASAKPAIVHIIFDEHIGLAGLPQTFAGQRTASELQRAYWARGFVTYGHAYSRHMHTTNAIPDILNFGNRLGKSGGYGGGITGPTDYFTGLQRAGYDLTIYQSNFLDFCSGTAEKLCVTYDRGSLQPMGDVSAPVGDRLAVLLARYLGASALLSNALEFYRQADLGDWAQDRPRPQSFMMMRESWSIGGLRSMERFVGDLAQARPGNVYFIHAMLPHFPYVATRECAVKPVSDWRRRRELAPLAERQEAYYDQLHCALRFVDRAAAALDRSPAGGNAIIVVHGDHGSRITNEDPIAERRGKIASEQMISGFSTLFAVRLPGQQPRDHAGIVSAPSILQALVQNGFTAAPDLPAETHPSVILDDAMWNPTAPMDMPTGW
jgi:hypothetical protein